MPPGARAGGQVLEAGPRSQGTGLAPGAGETACAWVLGPERFSPAQAALSVIAEPDAQLWWAAKELRRTKTLSDYVGRNEKTKIIVKIQQVSADPR